MAGGRIKGLTVTIDGDTTGLSKALQNVNKEIKDTQSQLKDVDKLLKLDPTNTELLSQKQRLLGDAIGETRTKLDTLKTASEQANTALANGEISQEQFDALQREIIETTEELKRLEEQAKQSATAVQEIAAKGEKLKDMGDKVTSVGEKFLPATAAVAGLGAAAVKTASDFDSQMSKVAAISGATGDDLDSLKEKAREMGAKTKFSASEAGEAFEYMAMAGWKTGDMLDGIEGLMNLAAASGEDLGTTADIVTDALTAFGLSASDSGHFADVLAAASSNANTNVSLMGETFKYAAPIAGALGFSVEDTAQAIGLMANAGIKASQGGTALRNVLTNMAKPTKDSSAAMVRLGVSLSDDEGNMYSFKEIMDQMRESFGLINMPVDEFNSRLSELDSQLEDGTLTQSKYDKAVEELTKQAYGAEGAEKARAAAMLAGKNGMSGLLAIVNASEEDYEKLTQAVADSSNEFEYAGQTYHGAAEYMSAIMLDNLAGDAAILKSQLEELAISIGDILMPVVRKIVAALQGFVDKLNSLSDSQKETIVKVAALVAAIGPLLLIVGKMISTTGKAMQGFASLGPQFLQFLVGVTPLVNSILKIVVNLDALAVHFF